MLGWGCVARPGRSLKRAPALCEDTTGFSWLPDGFVIEASQHLAKQGEGASLQRELERS